jgi:RNA polymerase sigma-70 factor (ECF subfamily)
VLVAVIDPTIQADLRAGRRRFLACLDPYRPELYRYCRRLTGDPWDAEDLVQETLTRALARAAQTAQEIERPLAWLVRIATNTFLDWRRRPPPAPAVAVDVAAPDPADPAEVRDALAELSTLLPPQERAAVVLKDVFDLPLADTADALGTTVGAVKAALHRGRGRLADPDRATALAGREPPDRAVLDALAAAFTAYDVDRIAALLRADATSEIVGGRYEEGREAVRTGSVRHTLVMESDVRYRAAVCDVDGRPLVVLFATPTAGGQEALEDVLHVETADGGVRAVRWYYFCPDTLTEVASRLGVPVRTHGYRL